MPSCWNGSHVVLDDNTWITEDEYLERQARGVKGYEVDFDLLPRCPEPNGLGF